MDDARLLADAGMPSGTVITACEQTGGRGRFRDRFWHAEPGANLLFTLYLDDPGVQGLPLRVGLAVARAITETAETAGCSTLRQALSIRWPNDVLAGGHKLSGILCESSKGRVYIGVGINANQRTFDAVTYRTSPTSLAALLNRPIELDDLLTRTLYHMKKVLRDNTWPEAVTRMLFGRDQQVMLKPGAGAPGTEVFGRIAGIADDGSIVLDVPSRGQVSFASGEIIPCT